MLTTSYVLCTKSQTHRSGLRWNMLLCAITNSYIYGNESYHKPEQIKRYDVSIFPFLINVSGKQYIPQISGCYLRHNRPRNIPCKKKVYTIIVIMIILNIFFLSMYTKNMIINENLLNFFSSIINLLSGFWKKSKIWI